MDESLWKFRTRVVALLGLIVSSFSFIVVVSFTILEITTMNPITENASAVWLWITWILAFAIALAICTVLGATIMLLKAMRIGADVTQTLRTARLWRNVNIVCSILAILSNVLHGMVWVALVVQLIYCGIVIFTVSSFIEELQKINSSPSMPSVWVYARDEDFSTNRLHQQETNG